MQLRPPKNISEIIPYPPGKPLDELEREYGITGSIKLASNENPWGPSPKAVKAISETLASLHRYPDGSSYYLTEAVAEFTWALILAAARRIGEAERLIRRGDWKGWSLDFMLGTELRGKQLGIIGRGRSGS